MCRIQALIFFLLFSIIILKAQNDGVYMKPSKKIIDIIEAESTPSASVNPGKTHVLFRTPYVMPDIKDLSQVELGLAGITINPKNLGKSRPSFSKRLVIKEVETNNEIEISGLPDNGKIESYKWSPDGSRLAMVIYLKNDIQLWVASTGNGRAKKWAANLNDALLFTTINWMPNSKSILFAKSHYHREAISTEKEIPQGPVVQESTGEKITVRTYQNLLRSPADEELFVKYCTTIIMLAEEGSQPKALGKPALYTSFWPSPNGKYIRVRYLTPPFSYIVRHTRFPHNIDIWTSEGEFVRNLAEMPLAEIIPSGAGSVRPGPRSFQWRNDKPATVVWVEAQDGGDYRNEIDIRDIVYSLDYPFNGEPNEIAHTSYRYSGIVWGWDDFAIISEEWRRSRRVKHHFFNPSNPTSSKQLFWEGSTQDAYENPGNFLTKENGSGYSVLFTNESRTKLYLSGQGASPMGNMPFLDELNISTFASNRIWQCVSPYYEWVVDIMDNSVNTILTRREAETEQPNYHLRNITNGKTKAFTNFPHPLPQLKNVHKELIRYQRADGVELSATLYLPSGYEKGSYRLPVLMWAYPREYLDADIAGQVTSSPYRFIRPSRQSPVLWVAKGYAVLERITMPVIGNDSILPNDTFVEQLVANAQAAINYLDKKEIANPKRIAIGGHSYGAFMAMNLLAHSDLFAAGIARSGAYNRTLTPFGFQLENRTLWEAPDVYLRMSPFMYADRIKEPVLLIHGEDDQNSGTFPMQSERMFGAINGLGGKARLVMLPLEGHNYHSRQSILHQAWEIERWLDMHLRCEDLQTPHN